MWLRVPLAGRKWSQMTYRSELKWVCSKLNSMDTLTRAYISEACNDDFSLSVTISAIEAFQLGDVNRLKNLTNYSPI